MIEIDASFGEGGGQILRSALALSVISGEPVELRNIRARRPKPGLKPQHLKAVEAAAHISRAKVEGAAIDSQSLRFEPGEVSAGDYAFDIGTAGSAALVLQTVFLPLAFAAGESSVSVSGGTHVPWSPCHHYLDWQWAPCLRDAGYRIELRLHRAGFHPRGGGSLSAVVRPADHPRPLILTRRGELLRVRGLSAVARLDPEIAARQRAAALDRLSAIDAPVRIETASIPAAAPGTFIILSAEFERGRCCAFALGARGKRAERVGAEAAEALAECAVSGGAIDPWLADQLVLPLCFANGRSEVAVGRLSLHLLTNVEIARRFLGVTIRIEGGLGEPGVVRIDGIGRPRQGDAAEAPG